MNRRRFSCACLIASVAWLAFVIFTVDPPLAKGTHVVPVVTIPGDGAPTQVGKDPGNSKSDPGSVGADVVRRQILDARGGTP